MGLIRRIWEFLFDNSMWLYIIMGLLSFVGIYAMTFQLLMLISFIYSLLLLSRFKINNYLDIVLFSYLFCVLINSLAVDYPNHFNLWYRDVIFSLLPISCYFIAKNSSYDLERLLSKMTIPITIAMLLGVYFYFDNPPWYSALKYAQLNDHYGYTEGYVPDYMMREAFRLSSIWVTPYVIGYANASFIVFLIVRLLFKPLSTKERRISTALFVLSVVVMILAGFKAALLSFVLFVIWSFIKSKKSKQKTLFFVLGIALLVLFVFILTNDSDYGNYFVERFKDATSEEGLSSRLEHTGGGIDLWTFWGNGFGHYGISAKTFGSVTIQDSQYQKTLAELGVFGFTIFIILLLGALLNSVRKKELILEFGVILFYTISFIGSSSISAETTFSFVFWYAMGSVSKKTIVRAIKNDSYTF